MEKIRVLFLAASPSVSPLSLDNEHRQIMAKVRAAEYRDSLEVVARWAVQPDDLQQALLEIRPHVLHFSGHGTQSNELVLLDDKGNPKPVPKSALVHLLGTLKDNLRLVVLNACYSAPQAKAITQVVDCAVGMNCAVGDATAITFAAAFYRAIGFGRSIQTAFDLGRSAIMLEGSSEESTPKLASSKGVDPAGIILLKIEQQQVATKPTDLPASSSGSSTTVDSLVSQKIEPTQTAFDATSGKEQLIPIVARLLSECPEALATILEFNKISEKLTASNLARRIIESSEPMAYLFNCVDRHFEIEPSRAIQHHQCFLALAEALAPICLTTKNLTAVYAKINDAKQPFADIDTKEPLVAKAVVGLIHGVPVDGDEQCTFERLSASDLRNGRDFAAAVPEPPELGVRTENIVDTFVKGLAVFLNRPATVGAVKAALKMQKAKHVYLCVLFSEPPNPAALAKLKQELEHIILLVSTAPVESEKNYDVLEQFTQIRRFFKR